MPAMKLELYPESHGSTLMKASAFGEVQENAASSRANDNVF